MDNTRDKKNLVQSVDRALELLTLIGSVPYPVTIPELCSLTGLNRTTIWRLLYTLEQHRYVSYDQLNKSYSPGIATNILSVRFQSRYEPLIRIAAPYIEHLCSKYNESVGLSVPAGSQVMTVYQTDPDLVIRLRDYTNTVYPLSCSSDGKMYLSFFDDKQLEQYCSMGLCGPTPHSISDPEQLRKELEEIRRLGYSINEEELHPEENGISAAIAPNGQPVAFISVAGPSSRMNRDAMLSISGDLLSACETLSLMLEVSSDKT